MPETAAALNTLVELLDDDALESSEDAAAAAATTGAWDCNTAADAVVGSIEEDFGLFPAGQAAETQTAEMAKSTAWSFISSKRIWVQESMLEYSI